MKNLKEKQECLSELICLYNCAYWAEMANNNKNIPNWDKWREDDFEHFDPLNYVRSYLNPRHDEKLFNDVVRFAIGVAKYGKKINAKTHAFNRRFFDWIVPLAKSNKNLYKRFMIAVEELGSPFTPESCADNWNYGI